MFPMGQFEDRFREILDALDAIDAKGGAAEDLEELNAEFEDALFMLTETDLTDDGWRDEALDAADEFDSLCADYRALAGEIPQVSEPAGRLGMLVELFRGSLSEG